MYLVSHVDPIGRQREVLIRIDVSVEATVSIRILGAVWKGPVFLQSSPWGCMNVGEEGVHTSALI